VHLGLDENVSKKEVQKINTFSLPVPSTCSFDLPDSALKSLLIVEDRGSQSEEDEERKREREKQNMKAQIKHFPCCVNVDRFQ
jgi:hypothetical protein